MYLVFPVNAKFGAALEALQLCLKLLPPTCRDELRRLLNFMSLAAEPQGIKLEREVRAGDRKSCLVGKALSDCIIFGNMFNQYRYLGKWQGP